MLLNEKDQRRLAYFFTESLKTHGAYNPKSVRWERDGDQQVRFKILCEIADLSGKSILDLGCGVGDLYGFLSQRFKNFEYLGVDPLPDMVLNARKKYSEAIFEQGDISSTPGSFDYILASGAMSFNVSGGKRFYFDMLGLCFAKAKRGVAANFLNRDYYDSDEYFLVYNPQELVPVCEKLTEKFEIIVGYTPGDFTVYLHK